MDPVSSLSTYFFFSLDNPVLSHPHRLLLIGLISTLVPCILLSMPQPEYFKGINCTALMLKNLQRLPVLLKIKSKLLVPSYKAYPLLQLPTEQLFPACCSPATLGFSAAPLKLRCILLRPCSELSLSLHCYGWSYVVT